MPAIAPPRAFSAAALCLGFALPAAAGTISPIQSDATPLGLTESLDVQLAASDERALTFYTEVLPLMMEAGETQLGERQAVSDLSAIRLDPARMIAAAAAELRIYFIGEGAGYRNSLLASTVSAQGAMSDPQVVFPDASTSADYLSGASLTPTRVATAPLAPGDFVDLGRIEAGESLALDLIANGANGGTNLYSTDASRNVDGLAAHVVSLAFEAAGAASYVLMGFEDLFGGGDEDYNDLVVAVDFGAANVAAFVEDAALAEGDPLWSGAAAVSVAAVPAPPSGLLLGAAALAAAGGLQLRAQGTARRDARRRAAPRAAAMPSLLAPASPPARAPVEAAMLRRAHPVGAGAALARACGHSRRKSPLFSLETVSGGAEPAFCGA